MSNTRFLKFVPSEEATFLRKRYPNAFLLLSLIAERARRIPGQPDGLQVGDAMLGDYESSGLTRQQYRTALDKLVELGHVEIIYNGKKFLKREKSTIKITINGTLVNLKDSRIWDINSEEDNQRINQRATNEQPTSNHEQERIRKNKKEKEEHTPIIPQSEEKQKDPKRVSESYSFKASSDKPSQTLKTGYGKEKLVYLTSAEYKKLCEEEGMSEVERTYWINQLEIAMMREGVKEFNRKNKSHYHTIIAWRLYREGKGGFNPVRNPAIKIQESKVYAEDAEKNYYSEHYQIHIFHNRIEFCPRGCYGETREIRFEENGFKEQLKNYLDKHGFKKLRYERA